MQIANVKKARKFQTQFCPLANRHKNLIKYRLSGHQELRSRKATHTNRVNTTVVPARCGDVPERENMFQKAARLDRKMGG